MKTLAKLFVKFYQRYISRYTSSSCRYYPTCSNYALWQLENNSLFKAIYFTISRILKCNQLFAGGFDYPIVKLPKHNNVSFKKIKVIYWFVPTKNNRYFVVKNREWKTHNE